MRMDEIEQTMSFREGKVKARERQIDREAGWRLGRHSAARVWCCGVENKEAR